MAEKPTIPNFPNLPDFRQMITQACEVVASVRGIPYDFNGTLSLENKFVVLFKSVKEMFEAQDELVKSYKALYDFVNKYFTNLDVQEEVNKKIQSMVNDGSLVTLITPTISTNTGNWLTTNITNPSNPPIDKSLTVENSAADSKVTGDKITKLDLNLENLFTEPRIPIDAKSQISIVTGNDVFTNVHLLNGHTYSVVTNYNGYFYLYNADDEKRYVFENGYCEFTPNTSMTMASGNGTFTATIVFIDTTDKPVYKQLLKTNGFNIAGRYHINYNDLGKIIQNNFIPLTNIWNYKVTEIIMKTDSIDSFTRVNNSFTIKLKNTNKDGFVIFNTTLQLNHKYAIYYDVSANDNYSFSMRVYNGQWAQIISNETQTSNVPVTNTLFVTITKEGNFSIDLTSVNNGATFTGTIKIYDITDLDNVVETFDYSKLNDVTVELKVNQLTTELTDTHLSSKKVVFYGDSITAQNKFPEIVKKYYGLNAVVMGVGGSTIFYRSDSDLSSNTRINNIPNDADIVMIMGGTNDWGKIQIENELTYSDGFDRTKFKGAIAYIIQHIQERCPKARIIWCTTIGGQNETRATDTPTIQYLPQKDIYGQSGYDFRNAEIEVCNILNIEICDTWSCGINGINAFIMIADTVHPTDAGAQLIADYIIGYLKTVII